MHRTFSIVVLLVSCFLFQSYGQQRVVNRGGGSTEDVEITPKTKKAIQEMLIERIKNNYAFPEEFEDIKAMLKEFAKSDDYKNTNKASLFGRMMTGALRDFTNDPHFNVLYSPQMFEQLEQMMNRLNSSNGSQQSGPRIRSSSIRGGVPDEKKNFNLSKVEVLPGNIGYMRINQMPDINQAKPTVDAAMAFLSNVDAFILDLRSNPGGVGGFTPYLASYFFPEEKKLLFTREFPAYDSASYFYTEPNLPGKRLEEQPLYILINKFTGSAATNFSYTMQNHGRAKVIGEITGEGIEGGHSAGGFPLAKGFIATVPIANVVHPVTGTNWSMTGVVPDVQIDGEEALGEANKLILEALLRNETDPAMKQILQQSLKTLAEPVVQKKTTAKVDIAKLKEFVGDYDGRKVELDGDKLLYARGGQPKLEMEEVKKDTYKLVLPPNVRSRGALPQLRFDRDSAGKVTQISFVTEDGSIVSTAKRSN